MMQSQGSLQRQKIVAEDQKGEIWGCHTTDFESRDKVSQIM